MKTALKFLAYLSAISGILLFIRPRDNALNMLLWMPKMISAALSPVLGIAGVLGGILGLVKRDRNLSLVGFLGAGLAARFMAEIPDGRDQFRSVFGPGVNDPLPTRKRGPVDFQPNLVIGQKPKSGKPFLVDLWQPQGGRLRSGLGIIYAHGSGWRVGDKDMLTRPFFRRLVEQGHVVLDIAYSLYPEADLPTMVSEVNQAIIWMKDNSLALHINPGRIVLVGGSAGAHLSLLAAYAPDQPEFQPGNENNDTSVRGVIAYYPPTDLRDTFAQTQNPVSWTQRPVDNLANALLKRIFDLHPDPSSKDMEHGSEYGNYLINILGGSLDEIPGLYDLLSPIKHVCKDCPPTLLLQGSDDVFNLAPPVRELHQALQQSGVPVILVEYPHTEHGFDLILPQISPVAQAATREVERFLVRMAN